MNFTKPKKGEIYRHTTGKEYEVLAIAKHAVINNFVDNYIDGRKLNRILQSSNDRTRFAMNG